MTAAADDDRPRYVGHRTIGTVNPSESVRNPIASGSTLLRQAFQPSFGRLVVPPLTLRTSGSSRPALQAALVFRARSVPAKGMAVVAEAFASSRHPLGQSAVRFPGGESSVDHVVTDVGFGGDRVVVSDH